MEEREMSTQLRHNVIVKYIYERKNNKLARQKS